MASYFNSRGPLKCVIMVLSWCILTFHGSKFSIFFLQVVVPMVPYIKRTIDARVKIWPFRVSIAMGPVNMEPSKSFVAISVDFQSPFVIDTVKLIGLSTAWRLKLPESFNKSKPKFLEKQPSEFLSGFCQENAARDGLIYLWCWKGSFSQRFGSDFFLFWELFMEVDKKYFDSLVRYKLFNKVM